MRKTQITVEITHDENIEAEELVAIVFNALEDARREHDEMSDFIISDVDGWEVQP